MIQEEDKRRSIRITDHELEAEGRRGDKVEKCEREKVWANSSLPFSLSPAVDPENRWGPAL